MKGGVEICLRKTRDGFALSLHMHAPPAHPSTRSGLIPTFIDKDEDLGEATNHQDTLQNMEGTGFANS